LSKLAGPDGSEVAKLALLAMNAVRNGDLHRPIETIEGIHALCSRMRKPDRGRVARGCAGPLGYSLRTSPEALLRGPEIR
jgi:hypothetical protein